MEIKIRIEQLDEEGKGKFREKATDLLSSILIKKLQPEGIVELVKILKDDSNKITW